jgi:hypothetical protein
MTRRDARPGRRPEQAPRDQRESAFSAILSELVARVPGARAAALVDRDGETVDYAGRGNPYDLRVAAAHLRIVLDQAGAQPSLAGTRSVVLRAARSSLSVHALPDGYALVLSLSRGAGFRGLTRAVPACTRRLADEAGWKRGASSWYPVQVEVDARRAPRILRAIYERPGSAIAKAGKSRLKGAPAALAVSVAPPGPPRSYAVEVLGRFRAALPEHEKAWRVRLDNGVELTLVRESGDRWYADEHVAS